MLKAGPERNCSSSSAKSSRRAAFASRITAQARMGKRSRTAEKSEERSGAPSRRWNLFRTPVATDGTCGLKAFLYRKTASGGQESLCKKLPRLQKKEAYQIIPKRLHGDMLITVRSSSFAHTFILCLVSSNSVLDDMVHHTHATGRKLTHVHDSLHLIHFASSEHTWVTCSSRAFSTHPSASSSSKQQRASASRIRAAEVHSSERYVPPNGCIVPWGQRLHALFAMDVPYQCVCWNC